MEAAHLRSAHANPDEEAPLAGEGEAPSFEDFYEAGYRRVFAALCLSTGNRFEAEEIA